MWTESRSAVINRGSLGSSPLIYATLYKTIDFTILIAGFNVIECAIVGLVAGEEIAGGLAAFTRNRVHFVLANFLAVLMGLIPFLAVKEPSRVLERDKIGLTFFRKRGV